MSDGSSLTLLDESSSDDDDEFIIFATQIVGHLYIYQDRGGGHDRMYRDYLVDDPTYDLVYFRRRFACV
jgi:hypothetical protein